jgi:hypothetical protein
MLAQSAGRRPRKQGKRALLFVNKKKQKNFAPAGAGARRAQPLHCEVVLTLCHASRVRFALDGGQYRAFFEYLKADHSK